MKLSQLQEARRLTGKYEDYVRERLKTLRNARDADGTLESMRPHRLKMNSEQFFDAIKELTVVFGKPTYSTDSSRLWEVGEHEYDEYFEIRLYHGITARSRTGPCELQVSLW